MFRNRKKKILFVWLFSFSPILILSAMLLFVSFGFFGPLPSFEELENPKNSLATEIISEDGVVLGKYFYENRTKIKYEELPENLINATLFQDEFDNIKKAYAPISYVQKISVGVLTDSYFKVSIDSSYNKYDGSQELLYGEFSPHAKTRIIDTVAIGQTFIDVDSTIGFPKEGTLSVNYKDGTTGIVTF